MKRSIKYCCIVVLIAILVGIFTFFLLSRGTVSTNRGNFSFFNFTLIASAVALFITMLKIGSSNCEHIRNAYCNCGNLALIGMSGTIVLAFLTGLCDCGKDNLYDIEMAFLFFFLVLMLGGIVSFLYILNGCHHQCISDNQECTGHYENETMHDYNRKEFIYPNNPNKRR